MAERGNQFLRNLDRYVGIPLSVAAAGIRRCGRKPQIEAVLQSPLKIGVICLGAIGDLLLASALINGLRRRFPASRIDVVASSANAAALPLIGGKDSSCAWPVSNAHHILWHVRAMRYDLLFDTSQWARLGNLVANLSGAGCTVGFRTRGQYRSAGYDRKISHRSDVHEVENFLSLGRALWPDFTGDPKLALPANADSGEMRQKTVYCHMWPAPGHGREMKQWPPEYWAKLGRQLLQLGFTVCFTGSPAEASATSEFIQQNFPGDASAFSLAGKIDIVELARRFNKAAAVISVNTGIMHLAALLDAPTIGLHGATNPLRWGPLGKRSIGLLPNTGAYAYLDLGFEYPPGVRPSMGHLPVEAVLDALVVLGVTSPRVEAACALTP